MWFSKKKNALDGARPSPDDDAADTPWIRAERQHDDRFLRMAAQVANWRMFAFSQTVIAVLAVAGVIHIGSQSKHVPFLVEVDKLGRTIAVRALTGNDALSDPTRVVYSEMFQLVENLRSVTTDRVANNDRLDRGYSRLDGAARAYVRGELRKAPANDVGTTKTVQVIVKSALKLTGKTWQIEWEEHSFSLAGEQIGTELWRATLQYELIPSGEEGEIRRNPIGFVVPELSWQKVIKS